MATDDEEVESPPGPPRWVWISAVVVGMLIVLAVLVMMVGGEHGPGRHGAGDISTTAPAGPVA